MDSKDFNVVFFGGSITQGAAATSKEKSYASILGEYLKDLYKDKKVNIFNAGVRGTGSRLGLFRLDEDVISHNPDLVFFEFSVNDRIVSSEDASISTEAVVRSLLSLKKPPKIIFIIVPSEMSDACAGVHKKIAYYYDIPVIDIQDYIWKEIGNEKYNWRDIASDNIHPNDLGHRIYGEYIIKCIDGNKDEFLRETELKDKPLMPGLRDISIVQTKEGLPTISINNLLLHSKYYPSKESAKFVESNMHIFENKNKVVVYGLGFGYHIEALLNVVDKDCNVYVFDADTEVIERGNYLGVYDKLKEDKRLTIIVGNSDEFYNELYKRMEEVDDILIYKPSVKVMPDSLSKLKMILEGYNMAKIGIEKFGGLMSENDEVNLKLQSQVIDEFFNKNDLKDATIVITSSGPSLDYNIQELKNLRGKVKIFTVGSALRTLINNGINPDIITIIDSQEIVKNQLRGFEDLDIPLCFLNTASRWAVAAYNGPKYMFFNTSNDKSQFVINTGKTVAVAAIDIAAKAGAKKIVLLGQDLAFVDNKTHTESFIETYSMDNTAPKEDTVYKKVLGVDGTMLNTTDGFLYFKHCIEKEIEDNPNIEFINCSKGARIIGSKECSLKDALV